MGLRKGGLAAATGFAALLALSTAPAAAKDLVNHAINSGVIPGPRLWVAGTPLGPTGGHGDAANGLDPELSHAHWTDNPVDSPEAARRAVRTLRRQGADLIKIMPSGGVMSIGD